MEFQFVKDIRTAELNNDRIVLMRFYNSPQEHGIRSCLKNVMVVMEEGSDESTHYEWEGSLYSIPELLERFDPLMVYRLTHVLIEDKPAPVEAESYDDRLDAEYSSWPYAGYEVPDSF